VSQAYNLTSYGSVNDVSDLMDKDGDYQENVATYLKTLKTRIVETKTFQKKIKLS